MGSVDVSKDTYFLSLVLTLAFHPWPVSASSRDERRRSVVLLRRPWRPDLVLSKK